jgi:hypothetical protein
MLNFVENLLENERDPRSEPMNYQDHCLSLSDPDRPLVLSHFLTNFLQNLASCHTALTLCTVLGIHDFFGTELAMIFSFHVGLTGSVMQRMQFFFLSVSVRHFLATGLPDLLF